MRREVIHSEEQVNPREKGVGEEEEEEEEEEEKREGREDGEGEGEGYRGGKEEEGRE